MARVRALGARGRRFESCLSDRAKRKEVVDKTRSLSR